MDRRLEWNSVGRECSHSNPWIEEYECVIGYDDEGMEWRARSKYKCSEHRFHVWFDKMETHETEDHGLSTPFLRPEVIYAKYYWDAQVKYYDLTRCDYEEIGEVVRKFAKAHNIK